MKTELTTPPIKEWFNAETQDRIRKLALVIERELNYPLWLITRQGWVIMPEPNERNIVFLVLCDDFLAASCALMKWDKYNGISLESGWKDHHKMQLVLGETLGIKCQIMFYGQPHPKTDLFTGRVKITQQFPNDV